MSSELPVLNITYPLHFYEGLTDDACVMKLNVDSKCRYTPMTVICTTILLRSADIRYRVSGMWFNESLPTVLNSADALPAHTDTILYAATPSARRLLHLQSSVPVPSWTEPYAVMSTSAKHPNLLDSSLNLLGIFDWSVWLTLLACFLVYRLIDYINARHNMKIFQHFLVFMIFFMTLYSSLYQNGLLISLVHVKNDYQFKDIRELADLVASKAVRILTAEGHAWVEQLDNEYTHSVPLSHLHSALEHNPLVYINSLREVDHYEKQIQSGQIVVILTEFELLSIQMRWCDVRVTVLSELGMARNALLFSLSTSTQLIDRINEAIMMESSLLLRMREVYLEGFQRVSADCKPVSMETIEEKGKNPFDLTQLFGVFCVLLFGLLVAASFFLWECCMGMKGTY